MDITRYTTQLMQFRRKLYRNFTNRADTLMELVDARCSHPTATSVVELSQAACLRRSYSSLFKAIDEWEAPNPRLPHLLQPYLHAHRHHPNLVTIARLKSNRTLYHQFQPEPNATASTGHPRWYGRPFKLSNPASHTTPDETVSREETSRRGKRYRVEIKAWHNMLMRGKRGLPMHAHPFSLLSNVRCGCG